MSRQALALALLVACRAQPAEPTGPAEIPDPPARTEWHREPVLERAQRGPIVLYNHADASLELGPALELLEKQYRWLEQYVGTAPAAVIVHAGAKYPSGFSISGADGGPPEMFLEAGTLFDSQCNMAHEMMHCFAFRFGALPHWFGESIADAAYVDSEIGLWKRRKEAPFLARFDRIDQRSYELLQLRMRYGAGYFPRVFRLLEARRDESPLLAEGSSLEERNLFVIDVLSKAAGEDLLPLFTREFGFDPRTRERQRGY